MRRLSLILIALVLVGKASYSLMGSTGPAGAPAVPGPTPPAQAGPGEQKAAKAAGAKANDLAGPVPESVREIRGVISERAVYVMRRAVAGRFGGEAAARAEIAVDPSGIGDFEGGSWAV